MLLDNSSVKCYFLDTGLLISHSFDESEVVSEDIHSRLLFGDIALNEGMLTENVVAQMLTAAGRKLYFFSRSSATDRKERMEVDFLLAKSKLAKKNNIRPVEVKSGKHTTHRSLDKFQSKYADWLDSPYLLWDKDLKVEGGIAYLPLYMAPLI